MSARDLFCLLFTRRLFYNKYYIINRQSYVSGFFLTFSSTCYLPHPFFLCPLQALNHTLVVSVHRGIAVRIRRITLQSMNIKGEHETGRRSILSDFTSTPYTFYPSAFFLIIRPPALVNDQTYISARVFTQVSPTS